MTKQAYKKEKFLIIALVFIIALFWGVYYVLANVLTVDWTISSVISDEYSREELSFVWSGDTGNHSNPVTTNGGTNDGTLTATYNTAGNKEVAVYAINSSGTQVSAPISCTYEDVTCGDGFVPVNGVCLPELTASCSAYNNAEASGNPQLFFAPGEDVYWVATQSGGDDPYEWSWSGDTSGVTQTVGPHRVGPGGDYFYSDIDSTYTAIVEVRDRQAASYNTSCSISVKECNADSDCSVGEVCRFSDFTCGPPLPIVVEPLFLAPAIINDGEQCNMNWEIEGAFSCALYRNGNLIDDNVATSTLSTSGMLVDPGSYLLSCDNGAGDTIDAGPARCLLNPEVRES